MEEKQCRNLFQMNERKSSVTEADFVTHLSQSQHSILVAQECFCRDEREMTCTVQQASRGAGGRIYFKQLKVI